MPKFFLTLFKLMTKINVFLYRSTKGKIGGKTMGINVLLLTTTGRKTGRKHTVHLGYFEYDGGYVITASSSAFGRTPAWLLNLRSNSQVTIQIRDVHMTAVAELASPAQRDQLWTRLLELAPGYADYQKRTSREIPMAILRPVVKS